MPLGVVTVTSTVPVPAGLVAVIALSVTTVKLVAAVVPKSTPVAPARLVPKIVTEVPPATVPLFGLRPVTVGWAATATTVSVKDWVADWWGGSRCWWR